MSDRVTDAAPDPTDAAVEGALRPGSLQEFVGQERVKSQLGLVLEAARRRGRAADHVLLSGPPGVGKTTLAVIIAAELQAPLRITSGPALQHAGDVAAVLASLQPGEVLFLDEIHRTARADCLVHCVSGLTRLGILARNSQHGAPWPRPTRWHPGYFGAQTGNGRCHNHRRATGANRGHYPPAR